MNPPTRNHRNGTPTPTTRASQTTLSSSTMIPLIQFAQSLGMSQKRLALATSIPENLLSDPEQRMTIRQADLLYSVVKRELNLPHLGLKVGYRLGTGSYNLLQHLLLSCGTLAQAYRYMCQYYTLFTDEPAPALLGDDQEAVLRWHFDPESREISRYEAVLAATKCWFNLHCGKRFELKQVRFRHPLPGYVPALHKAFGPQMCFDQPHYEIAFDAHWLNYEARPTNPSVIAAIEPQLRLMLTARNAQHPLSQKIRHLFVKETLPLNASQEMAAEALGISLRTMNRQLQQETLRYKQLRDEIRIEIAKKHLRHSADSIESIAHRIGYSSRRAFDRAFFSSEEESPANFRQRQQALAS